MVAKGQNYLRKNRLVAVVATYNRQEEIKLTIASLLSEPCEAVVIVDNGSTDGTREWLKEHTSEKLHIVLPDKNLGGAGGFELGIKTAFENYNPDWVVVMDDDARPEAGAFSDFFRIADTGWAILAAAVYFPNGSICEMNRPSRNPFWHRRTFIKTVIRTLVGQGRKGFHIQDEYYQHAEVQSIDAASFVGMFMSRDVVEEIGLPDGKLFIYGDDVAYSLRARKAGYTIGFAPSVRFQHACSTFELKRAFKPLWKIYYNYRNGLFMYKAASGLLFPIVAPICVVKWTMNGRYYGENKKIFYNLLRRAVWDGLLGRRNMEHNDLTELVDSIVAKQTAATDQKTSEANG